MDPNLPPSRQPSIETIFLEHCDTFECLNMDNLLTNPWSVEETNTTATTSTAADPNPTVTNVHRQGSPTLSIPGPLHQKIVDRVWAKIQKEKLPLVLNVGGAQRVDDLDAPPLSSSPYPYEIAGFPMESVACGDHQTLQESGGRMEMTHFAVQQLMKEESILFSSTSAGGPTAGLGPCKGEGMEWERGGRGKKGMNETDEKAMERRMKKLIRSRESAARFHAKKQAYTRELEAKVNQLREENARLQEEEQKNWATMSHLLHESMDVQKTVGIPRRHNSCPWW